MTLKLNRSKDNVLVKFPQKHRVITSDIQKTVAEYSNWKITEKNRTNMKKNSSNKKAKKKKRKPSIFLEIILMGLMVSTSVLEGKMEIKNQS